MPDYCKSSETMTSADVESKRAAAAAKGQGHIFAFWDQLGEADRQELVASIKDIDFALVNSYYRRLNGEEAALRQQDAHIKPVPHDRCADSKSVHVPDWCQAGLAKIREGKVAALLLAGGQGTRLGSSKPKGMYDVGLLSGSTLYQVQAERIRKLQQQAEAQSGERCTIPWYIMTSEATQELTENFFKAHGYFGISPADVFFFQQNTLPCLAFDGKIMLESRSKVAVAPDGNGGLYKALLTSGALEDMKQRGVEHVHVYCVDNILVRVADPVFVGYCIEKGADCGSKVVAKVHPSEAVGVLCLRDGRYAVVEYSEISEATSHKRDDTGRLLFDAANIVNHYFSIDFLERICHNHALDLPLHIARKKIATVDVKGQPVAVTAVNGMKLEMFVFDVFHYSANMALMYVDRQTEFSPLKNAPGASNSSPNHCREDYMAVCRQWIRAAGGEIDDDTPCDISPLVSYGGEDLAPFVKGKKFDSPVLLQPDCSLHQNGA